MTTLTPATPTPTGVSPVQSGDVREIALNRLKASPRNARRVRHSAQDIESRAASIRAKGLLQPLVVEPEVREGGQALPLLLRTPGRAGTDNAPNNPQEDEDRPEPQVEAPPEGIAQVQAQ